MSSPGQRPQAGRTPPHTPPGLGCHRGVRKMSEGAGRAPRLPPGGGHTHGTPIPASRTDSPSRPLPLRPQQLVGGALTLAAEGKPRRRTPQAPLRSPPRGAQRRRSPTGGRHGTTRRRPRRRGPVSILPLGRPGHRVRGAVGTFATLLAFHSRHVTRGARVTALPPSPAPPGAYQRGEGLTGREAPLRTVAAPGNRGAEGRRPRHSGLRSALPEVL